MRQADCMLPISQEQLCSSSAPIIFGSCILDDTSDVYCSFQENSDFPLEHRFLAPVRLPQPAGADPSPRHRLSGFHTAFWAFLVQTFNMDLHSIAVSSKPLAGLDFWVSSTCTCFLNSSAFDILDGYCKIILSIMCLY